MNVQDTFNNILGGKLPDLSATEKILDQPNFRPIKFTKMDIPVPWWFPFLLSLKETSKVDGLFFETRFDDNSNNNQFLCLVNLVDNLKDPNYFDHTFYVPMLQFIHKCVHWDSPHIQSSEFAFVYKEITFIALYFLQNVHPSIFIKYMSNRTVNFKTLPKELSSTTPDTKQTTSFMYVSLMGLLGQKLMVIMKVYQV